MMTDDISVNMFMETHIYSHLNKNNTKIVTLSPVLYTLRYLKWNVINFCIKNAKSFK